MVKTILTIAVWKAAFKINNFHLTSAEIYSRPIETMFMCRSNNTGEDYFKERNWKRYIGKLILTGSAMRSLKKLPK